MTALVQASFEENFLLFTIMGKKDCVRCPMHDGGWNMVRNTHVHNAISLMFPDIRSSVGIDLPTVSSTSALRPGRFVVRRGLQVAAMS